MKEAGHAVKISVLPVEVEADILLGLSDGSLTTNLRMVGEELGDGYELLFRGEVLLDTSDQLGHEDETVTVSGRGSICQMSLGYTVIIFFFGGGNQLGLIDV